MVPPVAGSVLFGGFGTVFKYSTIASISDGCNPSLNPGILPDPLRIISLIASSLPLMRSLYSAGPYIWNPGLAGAWQMPQRCWKTRCPSFWTPLSGFSVFGCCARAVSGKIPRKIIIAHWIRLMEDAPPQTLPRKALSGIGALSKDLNTPSHESPGMPDLRNLKRPGQRVLHLKASKIGVQFCSRRD